MARRAFIAGGSGLVGRSVLSALVASGRPVTALARSAGSADFLAGFGAEVVQGDLGDGAALEAGMRGCDSAFNVAGVNSFCLKDPSELNRVNVVAVRTVIEAAARAGVGRVVHTSSAATLGEAQGTVGRETSPHRGSFLSEYERSKFEGERVAFETGERLGVDVVCVNPSSVQGPGRASGTARILILYLRGKMRFFVRTTLSVVDIDDCAQGHLLAEERGKAGERYVLNGATLSIANALELISSLAGGLSRPRLLPGWIALAGGASIEALSRVRGRTPPVCRETVRTLLHGHRYDGTKAAAELGVRYTPIEETLARTIAWLRAEGLVPPSPGGWGDAPDLR